MAGEAGPCDHVIGLRCSAPATLDERGNGRVRAIAGPLQRVVDSMRTGSTTSFGLQGIRTGDISQVL